MTLALKLFASGQLPSTKGTLYTIPAGSTAAVRISLVNTQDSTEIKCNLYVNGSGTSRRIGPKDLLLEGGDAFTIGPMELEDGDLIEGDATVSGVVDYVVHGLART